MLLLTCEADCLLDDDPDVFCACMAEVCLRYSTSLKTFLSPPPALCRTLSSEPTFPFSTFTSTFSFRICKRSGARAAEERDQVCWVISHKTRVQHLISNKEIGELSKMLINLRQRVRKY